MNNFTFHNPTRIHFGEGQIAEIKNDIPKGEKVLVIYGGGSIKKNTVYDQVAEALNGYEWGEFSGVEPNPRYETLMKAAEKIKTEGFTYILAVGGGSVVDGSKFVAAAARYEDGDAWDICTKGAEVKSATPMSCVLTLPATGSESNTGAVITRGKNKLNFKSPHVQPLFAVLDPKVTLTLSQRQVSNGVIDAFVHVMEQYLTYPTNAKVQDRFAEGLLMTLMEEGVAVMEKPDDMEIRSNIMWSATLALNGLIGVGVPQDWTTHMIGHELTGNFDIDHARTLSIVLPAVMQAKRKQKEAKILQYAERVLNITEGTADERIDQAIKRTVEFFKIMQSPVSFTDVGLAEKDIDPIMETLQSHNRSALGEHGDITYNESRKILQLAL